MGARKDETVEVAENLCEWCADEKATGSILVPKVGRLNVGPKCKLELSGG